MKNRLPGARPCARGLENTLLEQRRRPAKRKTVFGIDKIRVFFAVSGSTGAHFARLGTPL
jgi:hypothetical protein